MNDTITKNTLLALTSLVAPVLLASCVGTIDPLGDGVIADLTTAEAESWCSSYWSSSPWWGPVPADRPIAADGTVSDYEGFGGPAECMMQLPVDQCVANLQLQPCQATLGQLEACLQVAASPMPDDAPCIAYLAIPSCNGTIVATPTPDDTPGDEPTQCKIRVR
jgi:hypothetical protein